MLSLHLMNTEDGKEVVKKLVEMDHTSVVNEYDEFISVISPLLRGYVNIRHWQDLRVHSVNITEENLHDGWLEIDLKDIDTIFQI